MSSVLPKGSADVLGSGSNRPASFGHCGDLQAEGQQPGCDLVDDVPHLLVGRVKIFAPFQGIGQDFRLAEIGKMPAVEIVIGGAGSGVEAVGWLEPIATIVSPSTSTSARRE